MSKPPNTGPDSSPLDADFQALLEHVRDARGFDFTGYKPSTLKRRFQKRMGEVKVEGYASYLDYLEVHPEEFDFLFNTLLINVTSFLRDAEAWEVLRERVIPVILSQKEPDSSIRVWSVGCSSGEEAYTVAIILGEILGAQAFRQRVKIYATDIDQDALQQARQATYDAKRLEPLSEQQVEQFFEPTEDRFIFRRDMRRRVIFGCHDLVQDAPISKIDLLVCRNTLMYFNAETQRRILDRFHFALNPQGFLFLGKAEMLLSHSDAYAPAHLKHRIFTKLPRNNLQERMLAVTQPAQEAGSHLSHDQIHLREAAFENGPSARVVIASDGTLTLANAKARELFNISTQDLDRPLRDLEVSYRPVELRSLIEQVTEQRRKIILSDISWQTVRGETVVLNVEVGPLIDNGNTVLGVSVNFINNTHYKHLREELENSKQDLEVAYEELQSTNEELETTNEELQSSNEELETTNEELQSTNEELETMNEELQSTNEELQTVNDELHRSTEELNKSNAFLESILTSLKGGVAVVNRDMVIQVWNERADDLWGIRAEEAIGQYLLNLDIGLPVEQLRQPIRDCLNGANDKVSEFRLEAVNRRGRQIVCRITCTPLVGIDGVVHGAIVVMEEAADAPPKS